MPTLIRESGKRSVCTKEVSVLRSICRDDIQFYNNIRGSSRELSPKGGLQSIRRNSISTSSQTFLRQRHHCENEYLPGISFPRANSLQERRRIIASSSKSLPRTAPAPRFSKKLENPSSDLMATREVRDVREACVQGKHADHAIPRGRHWRPESR